MICGRVNCSSQAIMTRWLILTLGISFSIGACVVAPQPANRRTLASADGGTGDQAAPAKILPPIIPTDLAQPLNNPADAHAELCDSSDGSHPKFPDDADKLTASFCQDKKPGGVMPTPHSLAEFLAQLGLDFKDPNGGNGVGGNPGFAILGHSSALTARKVSPLMPTAFIFTPPPADGSKPSGYTILAFDPGEQFVEVASHDPTADEVNFYAVFFDQDCTKAQGGCTHNDLLTQKLVTGWSNVRAYEDTTSLGNTIFDCHVCHQPKDKEAPFLRMQEIAAPFTHWFSNDTEGGRALYGDFHKAHNGDYGGIPAGLIDKSDPSKLATLIKQAGFGAQPNAFPSSKVEEELKTSAPSQPVVNVPAGASATWQALYDKAVAGQFIPPPYHDVKITDPTKLANMTKAYQKYLANPQTQLPDILDVFLDTGLRDMGFAPKAGLDGRGLIVQECQMCHNSNLDMTISRELFLVDKLAQMSRTEKDLAIDRLKTPIESRLAMPPALFRTITDDERQLMIEELQK
jgi:hypothetical protein